MICDFHMHSNVSDGSHAPAELVEAAARAGVEVLALTDHDDISGVEAARARGDALGVTVLSGVEISVCADEGAVQLHMLGLGIDIAHTGLLATLAKIRARRHDRAARMIERLAGLGVEIELPTPRDGHAPGRVHVADTLVRAGVCATRDEAFARYLRRGRPAYEPSPGVGVAEAIGAIHAARGLACLAHPPLSIGVDAPGGLESFVLGIAQHGLDGVEVWHPGHRPKQIRRLRRLAREHDLLETGGSDFHGDRTPDRTPGRGRGGLRVGAEVYRALCERLDARA